MLCVMLLYLLYYLLYFNKRFLACFLLFYVFINTLGAAKYGTLARQKMLFPILCLKDILCLQQYHNGTQAEQLLGDN